MFNSLLNEKGERSVNFDKKSASKALDYLIVGNILPNLIYHVKKECLDSEPIESKVLTNPLIEMKIYDYI